MTRPAYLSHTPGAPWTPEEVASMVKARRSGVTVKAIAAAVGVRRHVVTEKTIAGGFKAKRPDPDAVVARAIVRRIRFKGPQCRDDLLALRWTQTQIYRARDLLVKQGRIHVTRRTQVRGRRPVLWWGLVDVHPYAPSTAERILAHVEARGACWALDIAHALHLHVSTVRHHAEHLCAVGRLQRVPGPGRRLHYRAITEGARCAR